MAKQKRDNAYYEARLKREHPSTYADFKAGGHRSLGEALLAAGIRKPRPRVREMQNAWKNASSAERDSFVRWLNGELRKASATGTTKLPPVNAASPTPISSAKVGTLTLPKPALDLDRRLQPWAKTRVAEILSIRRKKAGSVMPEMGYSTLNPALGLALSRNTRLNDLAPAHLEKWILEWSNKLGLPL